MSCRVPARCYYTVFGRFSLLLEASGCQHVLITSLKASCVLHRFVNGWRINADDGEKVGCKEFDHVQR